MEQRGTIGKPPLETLSLRRIRENLRQCCSPIYKPPAPQLEPGPVRNNNLFVKIRTKYPMFVCLY